MLTYTMDVEERSRWIIATPPTAVTAQPYFATEVGDFYAREHFSTARSDKNSFIVFYTLGGAGLVRQGGQEVTLERGQALLMDCRTPQNYGTAPEHKHWYHLWTHVDGGGVSMAETTLTSAAIARQVGFTTESNFSYRFKQMVGQSPRAYRQGAPELVLKQ